MTPSAVSRLPEAALRDAVLHEVTSVGGAVTLSDLRYYLRGRATGLIAVLAGLIAEGTLTEERWLTTGKDGWTKQVVVYQLSGRRTSSADPQLDAEFDLEFSQEACPGCGVGGITAGWCGSCASVEGWHP